MTGQHPTVPDIDTTTRLLIVEDDNSHARLIELIFKGADPATTLCFAKTIAEARQIIKQKPFDLVITDFSLPDGKGLELLSNDLAGSTCPVMLLTGQGDEKLAVNTMKAGAVDYIVKSEEALRNLPTTVNRILREWRTLLLHREMEQKLRQKQLELEAKHQQLQFLFRQVAQAKEEWELTMDRLEDLVLLIDDNGRIRRANHAVCKLSGKGYRELIGSPLADVLANCRIGYDNATGTKMLIHDEISERWFAIHIYEIAGTAIGPGIVLTGHDFSEIHRLTLRLEESNQGLAKKTTELQEAYNQLKSTQAKVLHQEKMATIGQLAAGVAHEINNPIAFVLSNLGSLEKYLVKLKEHIAQQDRLLLERSSEEQRERLLEQRQSAKIDQILDDLDDLVAESSEGAGRVKRIVGDLKGFSHFSEETETPADLNELLDSAVHIVWNEIKYKAELQREYGKLPPVICHARQVSQVFMNLLVNAAQAISREGRIIVRTWSTGADVFASVSDNGQGIPDDLQPRIFDPFFTTKEIGQGTGLGLSISYDIVKEHCGELLVDSAAGRGTTITVRLPLASKGVDANAAMTSAIV